MKIINKTKFLKIESSRERVKEIPLTAQFGNHWSRENNQRLTLSVF
jgi:hypothetical protein